MKQKLKSLGKIAGSICCTIVGLCIAGYGIGGLAEKAKEYVPKQDLPEKENEEQ